MFVDSEKEKTDDENLLSLTTGRCPRRFRNRQWRFAGRTFSLFCPTASRTRLDCLDGLDSWRGFQSVQENMYVYFYLFVGFICFCFSICFWGSVLFVLWVLFLTCLLVTQVAPFVERACGS